MKIITFTMVMVMMLLLMTLLLQIMMVFTRVEFGHGSVTTVVCRRHRAFEDRAEDGHGVE